MDTLFLIFAGLFGLIIGSFLNCLIWRLYKEETLGGRSCCPRCRQTIAWYDNIPLLSFLILGGRCRHCHEKISWQYPLVEFLTALFFLLSFRLDLGAPHFSWLLLRDWLIIATLIIVFVYDLRWQLIPMNIVWPLSALIFVLDILSGFNWLVSLAYGAGFALFFLLQYLLTKKKGLGEGDIWLGLFLGLAFPSWPELFLVVFLGYGAGAIISLILLAKHKKSRRSKIALGPFLAFGAIITLIWGAPLINWFLGGF